MPINTNGDSGLVGAITDLRNLTTGGGTITASTAEQMLAEGGLPMSHVQSVGGHSAVRHRHLSVNRTDR